MGPSTLPLHGGLEDVIAAETRALPDGEGPFHGEWTAAFAV